MTNRQKKEGLCDFCKKNFHVSLLPSQDIYIDLRATSSDVGGGSPRLGQYRVISWNAQDSNVIVVCELRTNNGASVTNGIERIVTRLEAYGPFAEKLQGKPCFYYEHYCQGGASLQPTFDSVTFGSIKKNYKGYKIYRDPIWKQSSLDDIVLKIKSCERILGLVRPDVVLI